MSHRGQRPLTGPRITSSTDTPGSNDSSFVTPGPGNVTPSVRLGGTNLAELSALSLRSERSASADAPLAGLSAAGGSAALDAEDVPSLDSDTATSDGSAAESLDEREPLGYLLVIEGTASSVFTLPAYGEITIGRAPDAHLRLLSPLVSRLHARLFIGDGEARVLDLGSHNGTRVNGALIATAHPLASGDVIAVSDVILCFHRQVPQVLNRPIYPDPTVLRHRLEEEVDRCLRAGRRLRGGRRALERRYRPLAVGFRGLALLCVHLPGFGDPDRPTLTRALAQRVRLMDVLAFDGRDQLLLLLPDVDSAEAAQLAQRLLRVIGATVPGSRAGYACCPSDGCDGDTLLAAARGAMAEAEPAQVLPACDAVPRVRLGDRDLYFAEPALWRLYELCGRLALGTQPVLILGEVGSGRETTAATIAAAHSARSPLPGSPASVNRPFLRLDCRGGERAAPPLPLPDDEGEEPELIIEPEPDPKGAAAGDDSAQSTEGSVISLSALLVLDTEGALPSQSSASLASLRTGERLRGTPQSLEVLLFGIEAGAAPGVSRGRAGLLEAAAGGCLYLAEIGELSLDAQGRLLRALTSGRMTRVGGNRDLPLATRVLCSSSRDLHAEVRAGRFRADLLERLRGSLTGPPAGAVVVLPPLRERRRDLPVLIHAFLREACAKLRREPPQLSPATMERLLFHGWPGNLSELREGMEFVASNSAAICEPGHLPLYLGDSD